MPTVKTRVNATKNAGTYNVLSVKSFFELNTGHVWWASGDHMLGTDASRGSNKPIRKHLMTMAKCTNLRGSAFEDTACQCIFQHYFDASLFASFVDFPLPGGRGARQCASSLGHKDS